MGYENGAGTAGTTYWRDGAAVGLGCDEIGVAKDLTKRSTQQQKCLDERTQGDAARAKLVVLLDKMEDALKPSGWLVGKAYSIADIAAAPFVKRIDEEIAPDEMTEKKHPRVAVWWTRLQARPAYAQANFGPFVDS